MKVTFSAKYSVFAVQAEAGTLVSLTGTPTEVADGIYTVGDSGVVIVNEGTYTDSIYLSTTGSDYTVDRNARIATVAEGVQVWVGNSPLDCPFKKKSKGGGGNGYSETVLYTASSPHTNNIELSQAYTNFDDIVVVWMYSASSGGEYHNRFQQAFKTSALVADDNILVGEATSGSDFTAYTVVDTTHINFTEKAGTYYNWISKVIGIKYGSNGGAVANPVRSLAKSKEEEKPIEEEEPTDEMR